MLVLVSDHHSLYGAIHLRLIGYKRQAHVEAHGIFDPAECHCPKQTRPCDWQRTTKRLQGITTHRDSVVESRCLIICRLISDARGTLLDVKFCYQPFPVPGLYLTAHPWPQLHCHYSLLQSILSCLLKSHIPPGIIRLQFLEMPCRKDSSACN